MSTTALIWDHRVIQTHKQTPPHRTTRRRAVSQCCGSRWYRALFATAQVEPMINSLQANHRTDISYQTVSTAAADWLAWDKARRGSVGYPLLVLVCKQYTRRADYISPQRRGFSRDDCRGGRFSSLITDDRVLIGWLEVGQSVHMMGPRQFFWWQDLFSGNCERQTICSPSLSWSHGLFEYNICSTLSS